MLVVMYHYIRNDSLEYPNFNHFKIESFKEQLDFFEKNYGFVTKDQFLESFETGIIPSGVLLTFDDGLRDHYKNVFPILRDREIFAIFYVPTGHYTKKEKQLLAVHRVHHLKGKYDSEELLLEVKHYIDSEMLDNKKIKEFDIEIYHNQNNSNSDYNFKRLFNYFLKYEYRDKILDELMEKYFNESELYDEIYLTEEEIKELHINNFIIGAHTTNHVVLSRLSYDEQEREIAGSFEFLEQLLGKIEIKSFCYPYGSKNTFDDKTIEILKKNNVHHAFMVGNEPITNLKDPYTLNRIDCNRF